VTPCQSPGQRLPSTAAPSPGSEGREGGRKRGGKAGVTAHLKKPLTHGCLREDRCTPVTLAPVTPLRPTCATPRASTALALSLDCLAYMRDASSHTSSDLGQRSQACECAEQQQNNKLIGLLKEDGSSNMKSSRINSLLWVLHSCTVVAQTELNPAPAHTHLLQQLACLPHVPRQLLQASNGDPARSMVGVGLDH
jgi:hypothetical protein